MFELLNFQFIQNALIATLLISICGGIIGSLIVSNKLVFLGGGVAHSAFGGVGIALYFGFSTMLGAAITSIIMSLILLYFVISKKQNIDSFIAAAWAFGMALGVILIDITPGYGSDMTSYLFGSILAISAKDIFIILIYDILLLIFISLYYREILSISYDEVFCKLKKININIFLFFIFIFISLGIVMSMNMAGLILVLAILSIPAYVASMFVNSLRKMMIFSCVLSFVFICIGFFVSYKYNLSIGACVVMSAVCGMIISSLIKFILKR
ncbi:MAG: metal ABC transporter permease [Helicobacteraceae bacterium]|nr:metal ABC transporter permease [Helicobacteraceae bacterium]